MEFPIPVSCGYPGCITANNHADSNCPEPYYKWRNWIINDNCFLGICCGCCICDYCADKSGDHGNGCTDDCCMYHPDDLNFIVELFAILFDYFNELLDWMLEIWDVTEQIRMEISGWYELTMTQINLLDDILEELRLIVERMLDPPETDLNPIIELLQNILDEIRDLRIIIYQNLNGENETDRPPTLFERIINMLLGMVEWLIDLIMKILEEIILALFRGIVNIVGGILGWIANNLGAFFQLFSSDSPATGWWRLTDADWSSNILPIRDYRTYVYMINIRGWLYVPA
jgi:hypothetical protein